MTTFLEYLSKNPTGTFARYCRENILQICKSVAPEPISVDEIKNHFLRIDPDNPSWNQRAPGSKGNDNNYRHKIGIELKNLVNKELSNWKYKYYRYLSEEDRTRMHLDPHQVWLEVLRNARSEALDNNFCYSPDGNKKFRFMLDNISRLPYVYTQTGVGRKLIKRNAVEQIVESINVESEGRVQNGWREIPLRSAIVHCCDDLKFDNQGWITINKKSIQFNDTYSGIIDVNEEAPLPVDIRGLVKNSKQRAKGGYSVNTRNRRKIPHDIDDEEWIAEKSELTHCEITGIAFELNKRGPFQRSLDQRIPGLGYTKENTDVVVLIYNYAKNKFDSEDVVNFCTQFAENIRHR